MDSTTSDQERQQLNIELSEEVAEGIYANLAVITHSDSEFVIDFVRILPGMKNAKVKSRIFLTPNHAKRLLNALNENVQKFEQAHGPIGGDREQQSEAFPLNFGGPTPEA